MTKNIFEQIYLALQDTLTDNEEGEIIEIFSTARKSSNLNALIICLDKTQLLNILVRRWDEEYLTHNDPGWTDWWMKSSLPSKPDNQHRLPHLSNIIFSSGNLTYNAGKKVASALSLRYQDKPFEKAEDTNSSLQSVMITLVSSAGHESSDYKISEGTRQLALEILKYPRGPVAYQQTAINARMTLEKE
ncbi:MAG: hypothetical protein RIC35_09605 [Marinoscillum sp.]